MEKRNNVLSLLSFSADGSVRGGVPAGVIAGMCVSGGGACVRERKRFVTLEVFFSFHLFSF